MTAYRKEERKASRLMAPGICRSNLQPYSRQQAVGEAAAGAAGLRQIVEVNSTGQFVELSSTHQRHSVEFTFTIEG